MLISTENTEDFWAKLLSLPSWERGLKLTGLGAVSIPVTVAPLVGAWIETSEELIEFYDFASRSPRGSVD